MLYIESVEINGFWGESKICTNFNQDINCFIGKNGTGKTTFINILEATLKADYKRLISLPFDGITIKLRGVSKKRQIKVTFSDENVNPSEIIYKIGSKTFPIIVYPKNFMYERNRFSTRVEKQIASIREEIDKFLNITSLSIHRDDRDERPEFDPRRRNLPGYIAPIDEKLNLLLNALARYQLTLSEEANKLLNEFQKRVLISIIYDKKFDAFDWNTEFSVELKKEREGLVAAYTDLGILDDFSSEKINMHIQALSKGMRKLNNIMRNLKKNEDYSLTVDDVFPVPLLKRTQHIIKLSREVQDNKKNLFSQINQFVDILKAFITDKEFDFDPKGDLLINKNGNKIDISDLSSGEKQILIFLIETLLQDNKPFIFIADEPELSLHIEWQEKLLESIRKLNNNSQIIVATHSPEIVGKWEDKIKFMEGVFNESI